MYNLISIGIDESYTRTGISIAADGKLLKVSSIAFKGLKSKTEKRNEIKRILKVIIPKCQLQAQKVVVICERVRLKTRKFISVDYIKVTGALVGTIVDTAAEYGVKVFSVDTRSWMKQILGSAKGTDKQGTIKFILKLGIDLEYRTNKEGELIYNDDAADSACIALYAFVLRKYRKLEIEE